MISSGGREVEVEREREREREKEREREGGGVERGRDGGEGRGGGARTVYPLVKLPIISTIIKRFLYRFTVFLRRGQIPIAIENSKLPMTRCPYHTARFHCMCMPTNIL